ncbi:hypothetical protein [Sphingobium limneticum]|uniref:Uncharacterized protein n=1 Tax=Sphingobium limneticum TaxID=1007511 RepID=A0A5J5I3L2_9SPHN|nr:hypothetical protein [Sphingobium limneticum]KAA9018276.1 hypothetical protein F4U96_09195 [Sphingobium limneticum]KAA9030912.1 hypothetical protein F4U95_09145 [Sphingobium limneticum]
MNDVELAEHQLLVSLFIDYHVNNGRWFDRALAASDYNVSISEHLFSSLSYSFQKRGWTEVTEWNDQGDLKAATAIRPDAYAEVQSQILRSLDADTFLVDAATKRITTDAQDIDEKLIPCSEGWWLATIGPKAVKAEPSPVASHPAVNHAGRDIYNGPVTMTNKDAAQSADGWTRWGVYIAIAGLALSAAVWYFSADFPLKLKPAEAQIDPANVRH